MIAHSKLEVQTLSEEVKAKKNGWEQVVLVQGYLMVT
jgi:hypothetical protein